MRTGTFVLRDGSGNTGRGTEAGNLHLEATMNGVIYLIGLIVVIMFILSFLGLR
jgi:hypothetical protein